MARNISFALTTAQVKARTKRQTRRLGWLNLKPQTRLNACEKCQGLKPGEKIVRLDVIEVTGVRREPLEAITPADVVAEGFPGMTPAEFVAMFCEHAGIDPETVVTVIDFDYFVTREEVPLG